LVLLQPHGVQAAAVVVGKNIGGEKHVQTTCVDRKKVLHCALLQNVEAEKRNRECCAAASNNKNNLMCAMQSIVEAGTKF
jgi:hypothetical protein